MDRHTQSRLKKELVIWIVTTGPDLLPQAVPVWFLWDGKSFLVYAQPGKKVRDVQANSHVELHLNSDEVGGDVVRISGRATIPKRFPPATKHPGYLRKYRREMLSEGMTVEGFAQTYLYPITVSRLRFH